MRGAASELRWTVAAGVTGSGTAYENVLTASQGNLGEALSAVGRYWFQGRELDAWTNFYYVRARWLDPLTGTWLSEDPIRHLDDWNLARFVKNDPVNATDPTGLAGQPTFARWLDVQFAEYVVNPIARLMNSGGGRYSEVMAQQRDRPRTGWWWSHVPTAQELRLPEGRSEGVVRREACEERDRELRLMQTPQGIGQLSDEDVARVSRATLAREWWSRVAPGLAQYRSGCELWTGHDQYTGEGLTVGDKLAAAADFIPGGRGLGEVADQTAGAVRRGARDVRKLRDVIENHHELPKQFKDEFRRAGLDIEDYVRPMGRAAHRLKPNGLHTGPDNWNRQWRDFFKEYPNPSKSNILRQLDKMRKSFGFE